jgi:hypothetical protein
MKSELFGFKNVLRLGKFILLKFGWTMRIIFQRTKIQDALTGADILYITHHGGGGY